MTAVPQSLPRSGWRFSPPAGRLLAAYLVSLLLHGLLLFLLAGGWLAVTARPEAAPVFVVDLVHRPVLNPQAGRPEPRQAERPSPVPSAPIERAPADKVPPRKADSHVSAALQKLRDEEARQAAIERLRQQAGKSVPAEIRVGMPNAKGSEEGVGAYAHVQATLQSNWALSSYSLSNPKKIPDMEAWIRVSYSKSGRLEGFRFEKASGETQFDESIKRALMKSQQLSQPLPEKLDDIRVVFNLKALVGGVR